ncbi:MAG: hypothetical protein RLZZ420_281 [Bacteroidota bacterium]|jgi:hypothetical protein
MKKWLLFLLLFLIAEVKIFAEDSGSKLRISLLTCSPGDDLYAVFGHSAMRIVDSTAGTDIVYNFGTFDFTDPDFYTKFVRGKLRYFLSQANYADFIYEYAYFKRPVTEQVLAISDADKIAIQQSLFENLSEENRYYKYDFLFDNCTTRLRDLIFKTNTNEAFLPPPFAVRGSTFRDHLHGYLDRAEMPWTKLGIDILLGAGADRVMSVNESMFLPDPLLFGVKGARQSGKPLEMESSMLLDYPKQISRSKSLNWLVPALIFFILGLLAILGSSWKSLITQKISGYTDLLIFGVSGLLGFVLLFTWFGTDHDSFRYNLNLIWASPINILFFYERAKKTGWYKKLLKINAILILLLVAAYLVWPGIINPLLFPVVIALSFRSWIISRS